MALSFTKLEGLENFLFKMGVVLIYKGQVVSWGKGGAIFAKGKHVLEGVFLINFRQETTAKSKVYNQLLQDLEI